MNGQPPKGQDRRRRKFIDKRVQGRMIALIIVFMLLFAAIAVVLVMLGKSYNKEAIVAAFIAAILILSIFTVFYGLRFSHRIVGPIFAFNRNIALVRDGRYKTDMRLRKDDEFQNLAINFNTMVDALRRRTADIIELCDVMLTELGSMSKQLAAGPGASEQAFKTIGRLHERINAFREDQEKLLKS